MEECAQQRQDGDSNLRGGSRCGCRCWFWCWFWCGCRCWCRSRRRFDYGLGGWVFDDNTCDCYWDTGGGRFGCNGRSERGCECCFVRTDLSGKVGFCGCIGCLHAEINVHRCGSQTSAGGEHTAGDEGNANDFDIREGYIQACSDGVLHDFLEFGCLQRRGVRDTDRERNLGLDILDFHGFRTTGQAYCYF